VGVSTELRVRSSTKVWIGSTVTVCLGLVFGSALVLSGSALRWRSDSVLGLYNQSGWRFDNIINGDGKITLALGIVFTVAILCGLVMQSRVLFLVAFAASVFTLGLSIYEIIYVATRQGITGPGHGLYMVLGAGAAGSLCSLGGYLMMAERRNEQSSDGVAAELIEVD
jgi:hypothetical protein